MHVNETFTDAKSYLLRIVVKAKSVSDLRSTHLTKILSGQRRHSSVPAIGRNGPAVGKAQCSCRTIAVGRRRRCRRCSDVYGYHRIATHRRHPPSIEPMNSTINTLADAEPHPGNILIVRDEKDPSKRPKIGLSEYSVMSYCHIVVSLRNAFLNTAVTDISPP
jgi:hypothetical protein